MHTFRSSCPVVRTTQETFVQRVPVAGEVQRIEFTRPVVWLQQSESQIQFLHGGCILKEGSTFNDFYGYLTSLDQPTDLAALCQHFSIGPESSLTLVLYTSVHLEPATETEETRKENLRQGPRLMRCFACIPDDWRQERVQDGQVFTPRLERQVLGAGPTWSSKYTPEENAALAREFRRKWAVGAEAAVAP